MENHQWRLLREQKLWAAVTNSDLTVYPLCHPRGGGEPPLRRFIGESTALKHLAVYLWSGAPMLRLPRTSLGRKQSSFLSPYDAP